MPNQALLAAANQALQWWHVSFRWRYPDGWRGACAQMARSRAETVAGE